MIERVLGAIGLLICIVLLVRMALPLRRRLAFDARARASWNALRRMASWRPSSRKQAARVAEEAIERARRPQTDREGNVYRPKSFKGPRKPH